MDYLKQATCKDFTAWALNCPRIVAPDNDLRRKSVRKARRKAKQEIKKTFDEIFKEVATK